MYGRATFILVAAAALSGTTACGGGNDGGGGGTTPNPASTAYTGFLTADDGSSAGLALTFESAVAVRASSSAPVAVTGVATLVGGGTISLAGSIDNGDFTAAGGGFSLIGSLGDGVLNGRFAGPGGVAGGFVAGATSAGHPVYAYCGRYSGTVVSSTDTESGSWHAIVFGSTVVGDIIPDGASADAFLTGFLGSAAAGPSGTTAITVNLNAGDDRLTANGAINADKMTLSGTYSKRFPAVAGQSSDGDFSGDRCPGT
jgi:hypothetical protein